MSTTVLSTLSQFLSRFTSDPITSSSSTIDLGLDSIHLSELEFELKRVFPKANLQYGFTLRLPTIGSIVEHVERRIECPREEERTMDVHRLPLSSVQRRILFLCRLHPENIRQFEERISFSTENLDRRRLERSIRRIVMRHSVLRTIYETERQIALSATECHISIGEWMGDSSYEFIDIEREPPIRVHFRKRENEYIVCISFHHIAVDGRSIGIFLQELKNFYESPSSSLKKRIQYIEEVISEDESHSKVHIDYWKDKLSGLETQLLHTDFRRQSTASVEGNSIEVSIPPSLLSSLHFLHRRTHSTTFALFLSLYRLFVYKTVGYTDYPIGVMVENRKERNRDSIGCFVNSCVIRSPLNPSDSFSRFVGEMQSSLIEMRDHSSLPFEDVVSSLQSDSDGGTSPLFQVLFVMDNVSISSNDDGFRMIKTPSRTSKYEQTWFVTDYGYDMSIKVEYRTDLFREESVRRSIGFVLFLLQKMAEDSNMRMKEISLMRPVDTLRFHEKNKENKQDYPHFNHIIRKTSEHGNVRFKDYSTPMKKIKKLSRKIARILSQEFISHYGEPHRPDDFLVLFVDRSIDLIPLVLAGLECGLCLAPISLDWPIERRREVLSTIGNTLYVAHSSTNQMPDTLCLQLSSVMEKARSLPKIRRRVLSRSLPSDLLYSTFTSGTTGVAKCVCNSGEGMGNLLLNYTREYCVGAHSSVYQVINYAFDIFFCDLFLSLANGCELTLASGGIPDRKEIERTRPTHCFVMPAFLNLSEDVDVWSTLDTVLVTGETMQSRAFRELLGAGVPLRQLYGATEQTINNTSQRLHVDSPRRGVGGVYRNLCVRSVDREGLSIPHYWPALVRYSGPGLARGIFGQGERSKAVFPIDDCLLREEELMRDDQRCFDSGDVLRKNIDGNFVFVGRNDHIRKVRGRTVDLTEVEHHLSSIPQVSCCLVRLSNDSQRLLAYVVSDLRTDVIRKKLSESLTSHMVPDNIVKVERFPANANGKMDVKALPEPQYIQSDSEPNYVEPRNTLEIKLIEIFEKLLKKKISPTDDFFSSGGNSLLAMIAVQRIESELRLSIPLKRFFQLRTVSKISNSLHGKEGIVEIHEDPSQEITPDSYRIPLSPQQRHLWFQCAFNPESNSGHINIRINLPDSSDLPRLQFIINSLIMANDALRSKMTIVDSLPVQFALSATECFYSIRMTRKERKKKVNIYDRIDIEVSRRGKGVELFIRLHHILVDGRSLAILHDQLDILSKGNTSMRGKSYLRYCSAKSSTSTEIMDKWKKYLSDCPELRLPVEETGKEGHTTVIHTIDVSKEVLAECVRMQECTPFHILLSSFLSTLYLISSQSHFIIGVVHAGRREEDDDVVGLFTNTLPVRVEGKMDVESMKETIDFPFLHCSTPLGDIVHAVNPKRIVGKHPLFQHIINFQNASEHVSEGMEMSIEYDHSTETSFDTCWKIEETEGGFEVRIDYNQAMFGEKFIMQAATIFEKNLRGLIRSRDVIKSFPDRASSVHDLVRASWRRHLRVDSLNDDDNFFSVGGHSLTALAVINDITEGIGKEVPLRLIFEHQKLREFINCIREIVDGEEANADEKVIGNTIDPMTLLASSLQLPILERMRRDRTSDFVRAYNITAIIRMTKKMTREEVKLRFNGLCLHHPSLRTFFVFDGSSFYQRVVSGTECYLPIGSSLEEGDFDVFDCPPIAVSLRGDRLQICVSHLNVDGHSMKNLVEELTDFAEVDQCETMEEFNNLSREIERKTTKTASEYWKNILQSFIFNPLRTPPRSVKTRFDAGSLTKTYPHLRTPLQKMCASHHCTPFAVLLSSLGVSLQSHSLSRNSSVSIGWPVDLRSTLTEKTIGFATNTLLTTINPSIASTQELISIVSRQVVGALEHRLTPFEDLLRISGASNLFDVMLVMDPFTVEEGEEFEVIDDTPSFTKFPLTFFVQNTQESVKITSSYMKDLFTSDFIESILGGWEETLIRWANRQSHLSMKDEVTVDTIVERQRQFIRVEDLAELCAPLARCRAQIENGRIVLEYESTLREDVIIDYIKHSVPLFLHPDELRSCSFPTDINSCLPLSPQQLQMYFLSLEESSEHYNVPFVQRLDKPAINIRNLILSIHHIRQRNEALRTRVREKGGEPHQIVLSATESYYCIDAVSVSEEEVKTRLYSPCELALDLSLSTARFTLFSTEDELIVFLVVSHVFCDGWSTGLMQKQLSDVYDQLQKGEKTTPMQRRTSEEYAGLLSTTFNGEVDEDYLNDVIDCLPEGRSILESEDGVELTRYFLLDRNSSIAVNKIAAANNSTPFIIIIQSIARCLYSIFGTESVNIGTPVANRSSSTLDTVGCFMNTIVIPIHCPYFSTEKMQSYLDLNIPNYKLLKSLRSRLNSADVRLFDVFVNCRYGMESEGNIRMEGVKTSEIHKMHSIYPLEIYVEEEKGEYGIEVKMKRGKEETIERIVDTLKTFLLTREDESCADHRTEVEWTSESQKEDIPELDLPSILYRTSLLNGGNLAVRTPLLELRYSELWNKLVRMAMTIREEFFTSTGEILRADDVVEVKMQHGEEAILCCLSVLVAGGVYLPLLNNWPYERVKHTVEQTNCGLVIEGMTNLNFSRKIEQWRRRNLIDDAAYVIYTSGTTGKPKGVVAIHRGVVNMLNCTVRNLSMRTDDVIYQFTKFVFDNSVLEIWLSLSSGATLFIDSESFTHHRFLSSLRRFGITHALLFPGLVASFTDSQLSLLSSLRVWCMGAEKASQPLVDRSIEMGINVVQVYGPTETTTYALSRVMKREDHANNLGRALRNMKLRVKRNGDGVGELEITGEGLMRGYVRTTRDRSFTNGFYTTGDLVRVQRDGTVIFVGRLDRQVKVRGHRVDLNEVENVVLRYAEQVKVLFFEELQQLICFVKSPLAAEEIRSRCAQVVPDYMIPSRFVSLVRFPLTDNWKVDESSLGDMVNTRLRRDERDRNESNKELRLIEVLKRVGFRFFSLDDNFVEIGGQSITAMRLTAEIEREFGVTIPTHDLYRSRTLGDLITFLSNETNRAQSTTNIETVMNNNNEEKSVNSASIVEKIRRIWRSILNLEMFTDEDNFFLVGGDSFTLLKLLNQLVNEFSVDLSLADLIHNLTITRQVEMMTNRKRNPVSMLRISESLHAKGTIILLHPLIGGVQLPYRNIIAHLSKEFEILGFEHPLTFRADSTVMHLESIERLVSSFVHSNHSSIVKSLSKRVFFIGASLGSLLAFEMASQLEIEAEIIVIDGTSNRNLTNTPISFEDHRSMMSEIVEKYTVEDKELIDHMVAHSWRLYQISRDYTPKRNERISVHVFSCCGTDLNWSEIALVKSVNRLYGDHSNILDPSNSSLVVDFIRSHF